MFVCSIFYVCSVPWQAVKVIDPSGNIKYPIKAISVLKAHGKSAHESKLIDGYAINLGRAAQVSAVHEHAPNGVCGGSRA